MACFGGVRVSASSRRWRLGLCLGVIVLRALAAPLDSCASRARVAAEPKHRGPFGLPPRHLYAAQLQSESGERMAELAAEPGQAGLPSREEAEQKFNEAVGEAVEACAADTAGQRCYICLDGAAGEGLVRGCSCRGGNGFAHVSCLARGAQAAVERDADTGWARWYACGLCEQRHHGVVRCALGWACWKTYMGRPEAGKLRNFAINQLGNGLFEAERHEDALSVRESELSSLRRVGAPEILILFVQGNLASSYYKLGRTEEALRLSRDVHSGCLKLKGEEHRDTVGAAYNYASSLFDLERFEEAKTLLRETIPVARRVLGESQEGTLKMRSIYAAALSKDDDATLDDLREAVNTLEHTERTARRVFGGEHPLTAAFEDSLRRARATLRAREDRDDESLDDADDTE